MSTPVFCDFRNGNGERHEASFMFQTAEDKQSGPSVNCRCCKNHRKDAIRHLLSAPFIDPVVGYVDLVRGDKEWIWLEGVEAARLGAKPVANIDRSRFTPRQSVHVSCNICYESDRADRAEIPEARFSFWIFVGGSGGAEFIHSCETHVGETLGLCLLTPLSHPRIAWFDLSKDEKTVALEHAHALPILLRCFE